MRRTLATRLLLVTTLACAPIAAQAYQISEAEIERALNRVAPRHANNPALFGFAFEEIAREAMSQELGRKCVLSADPLDPLRDFVCITGGPGRPIQYQAKAALSATGIAAICDALRTDRYKGARIVMPEDTYAAVVAQCGGLAA